METKKIQNTPAEKKLKRRVANRLQWYERNDRPLRGTENITDNISQYKNSRIQFVDRIQENYFRNSESTNRMFQETGKISQKTTGRKRPVGVKK
jgi:hypothetical protein